MVKPNIRVFPSLEELSWAAASRFGDLARVKAVEKKREGTRRNEEKQFSVGLSGGATPRRLYQILADPILAPRIRWQTVHLFQVDERSVPPDHPDSNYRMIQETLVSQVPIPAGNVHRMTAEAADLNQACKSYAEELRRVLLPLEGEWPRLDLVFLGIGADGHTASLFPGTPAVDEKVRWVRENYVARLKTSRLTLTIPLLNAAAEIVFLVSGHEKAETLREVLCGPRRPEKYPAQRIQPRNGNVVWYADEAAAGRLDWGEAAGGQGG